MDEGLSGSRKEVPEPMGDSRWPHQLPFLHKCIKEPS